MIHPKMIWVSAGDPSTINLWSARMFWRVIGLSFPASGLLVTCMAKGTVCGAHSRFVGVSRKTVIRLSMNLSVLEVDEVGIFTAVGRD
jgi:hypothetical protein